MIIKIYVNKKEYSVDVPEDMPLLWVLRDILGLTGTKYSCGIGICGACMVHIDGKAITSCTIPVSSVSGSQITTIEGLSKKKLHPVQQAWLDNKVSQCGYCQPGMIMKIVALLNEKPHASEKDIKKALQNNLCRCGTYPRIIDATKLSMEK
jgi:isoquinoline 1-oxidoreductase alpha subunit